MPTIITREEALAGLDLGLSCLLCDLQTMDPLIIAETGSCVVMLPRYASRWGHVMIVVREHLTRFSELSEALWTETSRLALRAARAIETSLAPLSCYVASLGTPRDDLPMTSPHLHVHVIPIYDAADEPSTVLTWSRGVHVARETEWQALRDELCAAWGA